MATAGYANREYLEHLLAACTPQNREVLRISLDYGLRVGDVLRLPTFAIHEGIWSFKEEKTGKRRRVRLSPTHREVCRSFAGKIWVFEHRTDYMRHRTRQAVYKDITRVAKFYKMPHISPHSFRKAYAVELFRENGSDLQKVQKMLNHSDPAVTALYAMADILSARNGIKGSKYTKNYKLIKVAKNQKISR